ncbi:MAG TPA: hypothetical protein V6D23_03815 [Candidatus Obscuribacterales bacterium]
MLLQEARKRNNGRMLNQALDLYIQVVEAAGEPDFVEPYLGLAYIAFCTGQDREAFGLLLRAREIDPGNIEVERMWLHMEKAATQPLAHGNIKAAASKPIKSISSLRSLSRMQDDNAD